MNKTAQVVICGAGIAGVAAAHSLSMAGIKNVLLLRHSTSNHQPRTAPRDKPRAPIY